MGPGNAMESWVGPGNATESWAGPGNEAKFSLVSQTQPTPAWIVFSADDVIRLRVEPWRGYKFSFSFHFSLKDSEGVQYSVQYLHY